MAEVAERSVRTACGEDHPHEALVEALALFDKARARRVAGQVWECPEEVPVSCCLWLRLPLGMTYGELARRVRRGGF